MKKYLIVFVALIALVSTSSFVKADTTANDNELSGWAWSSNTGWISLNSADDNTGNGGVNKSSIPYSITIDANGNLNGYAWSSNIGWIKFGGLSDFPSAPLENAKLSTTTGAITGWARACAGTVNGNCSGGSRTDGWDGWILLSGTNFPSAYNPGCSNFGSCVNGLYAKLTNVGSGVFDSLINGFAWGDVVNGWISFNAKVMIKNPALVVENPVVDTCTANPQALPLSGGDVTWTATASKGTGPYTYSWNSASNVSNNTFTKNYGTVTTDPTTNTGPTVSVKDNSTPSKVSSMVNCPNVVQSSTITAFNPNVSLKIFTVGGTEGSVTDSSGLETVAVDQGISFKLKWINGSSCVPKVMNYTGSSLYTGSVDPWGGSAGSETEAILHTATMPANHSFIFQLTCSDTVNTPAMPDVVEQVKLKVGAPAGGRL